MLNVEPCNNIHYVIKLHCQTNAIHLSEVVIILTPDMKYLPQKKGREDNKKLDIDKKK